jgi:hypothetical protein
MLGGAIASQVLRRSGMALRYISCQACIASSWKLPLVLEHSATQPYEAVSLFPVRGELLWPQ